MITSENILKGSTIVYKDKYNDTKTGVVKEVLPYDKEVGIPHYSVENYDFPISLVDIIKVTNIETSEQCSIDYNKVCSIDKPLVDYLFQPKWQSEYLKCKFG